MRYVILFVFFAAQLHGQSQTIIEPCKFGQPLINQLRASYPQNTLGYNIARDTLYSKIDNVGNQLSGIYTGFTVTLNPMVDPSSDAYNKGINAEHSYPQSKGASNEPARSDLHSLFPCKVNVNSSRGNCFYYEIPDADTDTWYKDANSQSSIPTSDIDDYSEKDDDQCLFEPRESVKGDIARAQFYFYMMYQNLANQADPFFFQTQKETLLQWHYDDPVDAKEARRDSLIGFYQGNSNPFILDSTLARRAFFMPDGDYPDGDPNCYGTVSTQSVLPTWFEISNTAVTDLFRINLLEQNAIMQIVHANGLIVNQLNLVQGQNTVDLSNYPNGMYFLNIQSEDKRSVQRIVKLK